MSISRLIERLSINQKIFFIGFLSVLFLVLWFSFISKIETKINDPANTDLNTISFDASLCTDQETQLEICQLRLDALDLIKKLKEIKKNALATNVGIWAADDLNSLESIEKEAEKYFNKALFSEAIEKFNEGIVAANKIIEIAAISLDEFIDSGFNFLFLNNAIDAEIFFRKALEIDPSNSVANRGLNRALVLDKVSKYINDAQLLISVNSLDQAMDLIDKAAQLDNEYQGLDKLRLDVIKLIKIRDLNAQITDGFKYLKLLKFNEAKINFDKALLIDKNSKLAIEGINLANEGIKKNIIETEKVLAHESLNLEDFSKSSLHFQNILNLDPNIKFAILGLEEVKKLKELEFHLDRYIDRPDRLSSPNVYDEALVLLISSSSLSLQKRISAKKERLEFLLTKFSEEINITLISDNKTQVTVQNVGSIGIFNQKEIKLNPGKYTFVGKRKGFVTIRRVIDLNQSTTIKIQCIEKL
jgi:tetratricopeptide (TPR) repeat protein